MQKLAINLFEPIENEISFERSLVKIVSSGEEVRILFYLMIMYSFFNVIFVVMYLLMFGLPLLYLVFIVADNCVSLV